MSRFDAITASDEGTSGLIRSPFFVCCRPRTDPRILKLERIRSSVDQLIRAIEHETTIGRPLKPGVQLQAEAVIERLKGIDYEATFGNAGALESDR
jgi:hypothetical protein